MEDWKEKKVKLKHKFTTLIDYDLSFVDGHKEDMILKLQIKLSKTKEEILKILSDL